MATLASEFDKRKAALILGKNLDDLKVSELKSLLGQRVLKESGRKSKLQQRQWSALMYENIALESSGDAGQAEFVLSDNIITCSMNNHANDPIDEEAVPRISVTLPSYEQINCSSNRKIYSVDSKAFCVFIVKAYNDAVHQRTNLFKLPSGKAGKAFVNLQTEWLSRFNNKDSFMYCSESIDDLAVDSAAKTMSSC